MLACQESMELISAALDDEITAAERTRLQEHLHDCAHCREVQQSMALLGQQLVALDDCPLGPAFATKTADVIRRHIPPARPPAFQRVLELWNHPIHSLSGPMRKRNLGFGLKQIGISLAAFGIPTLLLAMRQDKSSLFTFLLISAVGLMVGIPLRHFSVEVSLLGSLRRGRCLEEILGTGFSPSSLVDALALQGATQLLKAAVPMWLVFIVGAMAFHHPAPLLTATMWLPACIGFFVAGSYACQFFIAWSEAGLVRMGAGALAFLATLGGLYGLNGHGLLVLPGPEIAIAGWSGPAPIPVLQLAYLAVCAVIAGVGFRRLAVHGLEHPESVQRFVKVGKERNQHSLRSENPIAGRELARVSGRVAGGWKRLFAWRLGMIVAPAAWGLWATTQVSGYTFAFPFWTGVALFSFLFFARAAVRTMPAVVNERERRTWEPLLQTQVGLGMMIRGWIQVALYTVFVEGMVAMLTLLAFALLNPSGLVNTRDYYDGLRMAGLGCLLMAGSTLVGALVGLAVSAGARTSRDAGNQLMLVVLAAAGCWLLSWAAILAFEMPHFNQTGMPWVDVVEHDAPLAAFVLVCAGLLLWSRRELKTKLLAVEVTEASVKAARRYPIAFLPMEVAAPGFVLYSLGLLKTVAEVGREPLAESLTLLSLVAVWIVCLRTPLATLCELLQGRLVSVVLGCIFGAGLYLGELLMFGALRGAGVTGYKGAVDWSSLVWPGLFVLSLAFGVIAGCLAARAPLAVEDRGRVLRRRLLWSSSSTVLACCGLWIFLQSSGLDYRADQFQVTKLNSKWYTRNVVKNKLLQDTRTVESSAGSSVVKLGTLQHVGDWEFFAALRGAGDARAARKMLEGELDVIEVALREHPVPMLWTSKERENASMRDWRALSFNLDRLGRFYAGEGRFDEALRCYRLSFETGETLTGHGKLVHEANSGVMTCEALQGIVKLLETHRYDRKTLGALSAQLAAARHKPENFGLAAELEFAEDDRYLAGQTGLDRQDNLCLVPLPPFLLNHQREVTAGVYLMMLPAARKLDYQALASMELGAFLERFPLAAMAKNVVPGLAPSCFYYAQTMSRLQAARMVVERQLHGAGPLEAQTYTGELVWRGGRLILIEQGLRAKSVEHLIYSEGGKRG